MKQAYRCQQVHFSVALLHLVDGVLPLCDQLLALGVRLAELLRRLVELDLCGERVGHLVVKQPPLVLRLARQMLDAQ